MTPLEVVTNRVKELEEENKMLKQLLVTRESSALWHKTRLDIRLILEKITKELTEFTGAQKRWVDRSAVLFEKIFKPDEGPQSFLLFEQWKLVLEKYALVKKQKSRFQKRLKLALINLQKTETQWSDPGVEQFEFAQKMTTKQRKKLLKKCKVNDDIAREALAIFETFNIDWDGVQSDLQDCVDRVEKIYEDFLATRNE